MKEEKKGAAIPGNVLELLLSLQLGLGNKGPGLDLAGLIAGFL